MSSNVAVPTESGDGAEAAVPDAGTCGVRGGPTSAATRSPPASAGPGHTSGPQAEPPERHTGAVAVAPKPAPRCSRRSGPGAYTAATAIACPIRTLPLALCHACKR